MLKSLDYTIRIGTTPTILYFDLYLYSAYAVHALYVYGNHLCCLGQSKLLVLQKYAVPISQQTQSTELHCCGISDAGI